MRIEGPRSERKKAGAASWKAPAFLKSGRSMSGGCRGSTRLYCAAGKPWIFIPGLMPFDENQPLLISSAYTPLFVGQ
jgi:hypothetical protein